MAAGGADAVQIRHGNHHWQDFLQVTHLRPTPGTVNLLFDCYNVVDTFLQDVVADLGVDIDHRSDVNLVLCSCKWTHREEIFLPGPCAPLVSECDGYIFTDHRVGYYRTVDVYRES